MNLPDPLDFPGVADLIRLSLNEDIGPGDVTTLALVPGEATATAVIIAREPCVVAGEGIARAVFRGVDEHLTFDTLLADGETADSGDKLLVVTGPARGILTAERTALNFMQRMCGIATMTSTFAQSVEPYGTTILDTRKTTPGLRFLEKYSVLCGGGTNHRVGLYDRTLIKDNHRRFWHGGEGCSLDMAVRRARQAFPDVLVEVEVENQTELLQALAASPDWVLLDNMTTDELKNCVALCRDKCLVEASGGITLRNVEAVAQTGVDAISLGCLTHSSPSVDLSLELTDHDLSRC